MTITIAANTAAWGTGTTTIAIDALTDNHSSENGADETIIITGSATGLIVAPAEIILTDGPYLNFGKYTESVLYYRSTSVSTAQPLPTIVSGTNSGTIAYTVTSSPSSPAHGLTHGSYTSGGTSPGSLSGTVANSDSRTLYTITATDTTGASATATFSVMVIQDRCSNVSDSAITWDDTIADRTEVNEKTDDVVHNCNVLLEAKDDFVADGTVSTVLNWSTGTNIHDWHGVCFQGQTKTAPWNSSLPNHRLNFFGECKESSDTTKVNTGHQISNLFLGDVSGVVQGNIPPVLGHARVIGMGIGLEYAAVHFWGVDANSDSKFYRKTDNNNITGPIPPEFGNLNGSTVLSLGGVNLSRSSDLDHLCALADMDEMIYLYLHKTRMQGSIPACLYEVDKPKPTGQSPRAQSFRSLYLNDNNLSGRIPWQLGLMKYQGSNFWLQGNNLSGSIPWQLGYLGTSSFRSINHSSNGRTYHVDLSHNDLSGPIPWQVAGMKARRLYLNDNNLSGSIPPQIALNKGTWGRVWLNNNQLTGTIPPEIDSPGNMIMAWWGSAYDLRNETGSWENPTTADLTTDTLKAPLRLDGNQLVSEAELTVSVVNGQLDYDEDGQASIEITATVTLDDVSKSIGGFPAGVYPNAVVANAAAGDITVTLHGKTIHTEAFSIAKCAASQPTYRCTQSTDAQTKDEVTFTVNVEDDDQYTGDGKLEFGFSEDTYAAAGAQSAGATALVISDTSRAALPRIRIKENEPRNCGMKFAPAGNVSVPEGGTATYTVALTAQPTHDVPVNIYPWYPNNWAHDSDITVSGGASLTFTYDNWNQPQTVTLSAAEDSDSANGYVPIAHRVHHSAIDNCYYFMNQRTGIARYRATEADNDVSVSASVDKITPYEGEVAYYRVSLDDTAPTADVTVTLTKTGDDDVTVDTDRDTDGIQNTLTFTTDNWSSHQWVYVTPAHDNDHVDDTATITHDVSSADPLYNAALSFDVNVIVTDDDLAAVLMYTTDLSLDEGDSATYEMALNAAPTHDVTVTLTKTGDDDITVGANGNQNTLVFTPTDYGYKMITVSAARDSDEIEDTATISHAVTSSDSAYNGAAVNDVSVTVKDGAAPTQPPPSVDSVTATHNGGSLSASWPAAARATSYHVTYSSDAGASWSLAARHHTGADITINGVDNAKTYLVGVRARNSAGDSGWVNSSPAAPPGQLAPPDAVASVSATHNGNSLSVSWPAAARASSYHVTYSSDNGASWSLAALNHSGVNITINNVNSGKTYLVGVRARNSAGDSGWVNSPPASPP